MKLKRFSAIASALILALASLFTLAFSGEAQAAGSTLYWCNFSSNSNFGTSSNWYTNSSCNSGGSAGTPASGDSLVFDNSSLNSTIDVTNNLSGLDLSSITFQGNGSGSYVLSGDPISLDSGITDTESTSAVTNAVNFDITLTDAQTITNASADDTLSLGGTINLGANNLELDGDRVSTVLSGLTGSGALDFDGTNSGGPALYTIEDANTSFTGPVTIQSKASVTDDSGTLNGLGTGTINIESNGSLVLSGSATTGTLSNNLNLDGSGDGTHAFGALVSCLGNSSGCTTQADTTLTVSGNVALGGDAEVVNGAYQNGSGEPPNSATFDFTGNVSYGGGYTLTAFDPSGSNTALDFPSASTSGGGTGGGTSAPNTPDTGSGLASDHSGMALIGTILLTLAVAIPATILRKFNKTGNK